MFRARRRLALVLTALPLLGAGNAVADEKYPNRPVTLVVPQSPGGANDAIARIVAQKLSESIGQTFVVENRPGAGGNIGTAIVAKAKPDGYTLLLTADSAVVINPSLYKSTGFDTLKDLEPVATLATSGYVLVANNNFPARNVSELVSLAKAKPGGIAIGSAGNGTLNHLVGEMLCKAAGIDLLHVPYKGAAAAVADLVSGQVQVSVQSLPSSISYIKGGRIKVLGVVNEKRVAALADSPTIGESLKGFGVTPWYGMFAPAGTPKAMVDRIYAEVGKVLESAEAKEKLAGVGTEPFRIPNDQFLALIRSDLAKWAKVVKESGATVD